MGIARTALTALLLSCATCAVARAQAEAGADEEAEGTAVAPGQDEPTETGYEPDQRGAIEGIQELSEGMSPAQGAPPSTGGWAADAEYASAGEEGAVDREPKPLFYLELGVGYSYLDPIALSSDPFELGGADHHGLALGLAAGVHLPGLPLDLGLRFEHGFHDGGVAIDELLADARLTLPVFDDDDLVPQLRLGIGFIALSELGAYPSAQAPGTLTGLSIKPGIGLSYFVSDSLSLGAAFDVGFSSTAAGTANAGGVQLELRLDAGLHF